METITLDQLLDIRPVLSSHSALRMALLECVSEYQNGHVGLSRIQAEKERRLAQEYCDALCLGKWRMSARPGSGDVEYVYPMEPQ